MQQDDDESEVGFLEKSSYKVKRPGDELSRLWALIGLFSLTGICILIGAYMANYSIIHNGDEHMWGIAREFTELTLAPLSGLLGVAIAYYYRK